jgi:cell division protease FtsH
MCDSFTAVSGSMFVEMYVGRGAARIRSLFAKARRDAIHRRKMHRAAFWWSNLLGFTSAATRAALERPPCAIIFIDELDAVAKARSSDSIHGNDEREQTLNELLTEMDGFETGRSKGSGGKGANSEDDVTLIVIAASNRVDVIDEAVLRRFDRQILVGYPNEAGRKAILRVHATKIQCAPNIDWEELASSEHTDNFSGADLRNVVNEAALFAIREKSASVHQSHLMHAARRIRQMKSRTSRVSTAFSPVFLSSID